MTKATGRIEITDTLMSAILKMAEGNAGAIEVLAKLYAEGPKIDPDSAFGGFAPILDLDYMGIYGSRIWTFYRDCCDSDIPNMLAVLRGIQLGFERREEILKALDKEIKFPCAALMSMVQERLPNFNKPKTAEAA